MLHALHVGRRRPSLERPAGRTHRSGWPRWFLLATLVGAWPALTGCSGGEQPAPGAAVEPKDSPDAVTPQVADPTPALAPGPPADPVASIVDMNGGEVVLGYAAAAPSPSTSPLLPNDPPLASGDPPLSPGEAEAVVRELAPGEARLSVPPGALDHAVTITVEAVTDALADPVVVPGTAKDFGPDGLRFARPAELVIAYDRRLLPAGVDEASLRLHKAYSDGWREVPGSTVDVVQQVVRGPIGGFSTYALRPPTEAAHPVQMPTPEPSPIPTPTPSPTPTPTYLHYPGLGSLFVGVSMSPHKPTVEGPPIGVFKVTPALPAGLSLDATTGTITGTPTRVAAAQQYAVSGYKDAAAGSPLAVESLTIAVLDAAAPEYLLYHVPSYVVLGDALSATPITRGGAITRYTVEPALPAGIGLDPVTGVISGTATALTPATNYWITGENAAGSSRFEIRFEVGNAAPQHIAYSSASGRGCFTDGRPSTGSAFTCLKDTTLRFEPSSPYGRAPTAYRALSALPAGFSLDPVTGVISGSSSAPFAAATAQIEGSNAAGALVVSFALEVLATRPVE